VQQAVRIAHHVVWPAATRRNEICRNAADLDKNEAGCTIEEFIKKVVPALPRSSYKNVWRFPRSDKITINIGMGEATQNAKLMDGAVNELSQIAGQKPVITKATKSIAAFKLREGMPIGVW
jgi:ribosomal protein L5